MEPQSNPGSSLASRLFGPINVDFVLYATCLLLFADLYLATTLGVNLWTVHTLSAVPPAGHLVLALAGYLILVGLFLPWLRSVIQQVRGFPTDRRPPDEQRAAWHARQRTQVPIGDLEKFAWQNNLDTLARHLAALKAKERADDHTMQMVFIVALLLLVNTIAGFAGSTTVGSDGLEWIVRSFGGNLGQRLAAAVASLLVLAHLIVGLNYGTRYAENTNWIDFPPERLGRKPPSE
jgi:hypothetical protein